MQFRVLGPVEVYTAGGQLLTVPRRQDRCVLAILLLEAGRVVPTERLCNLLWEEHAPQRPERAIHTSVSRIRAALARAGAGDSGVVLAASRGGYVIDVDPEAVDVHRFRRLLDEAVGAADPQVRNRLLQEALALWRGPALANAASDSLRRRLCTDLEELRLHAREESLAARLEAGEHHEVLAELAGLRTEWPSRERLIELHMLALYRSGRGTEALAVYRRARTRLADESGLDPGAALQELHRTILRGDPLPTPLVPTRRSPSGGPTPALLPADLTTFIGRAAQLDQLDALLASKMTAVVISAIAGTAGVGKTALAVHWAHRVRGRFPDGQLYANLRGFDPVGPPARTEEVIRRFLEVLGVPSQHIPVDLDSRIDLYRSLLADKRALVVLDNARDAGQVRPLLPGAPGCLTVVTSRDSLSGLVALDGAHCMALDLLTDDEARRLLGARLGSDRVEAEPEAVDEVVSLCARLPLALAVAAAHAAVDRDRGLKGVLEALRGSRSTLHSLSGADPASNVRAVFSCSYLALNPDAARMFRLLGLCPGADVSVLAAASLAGVEPDLAERLLAELTTAHLVVEHVRGRYTLHDLLRAYAAELAERDDTEDERRLALHRVLDHYGHTAYVAALLVDPYRHPIDVEPVQPGVTPHRPCDHLDALGWFDTEHQVLLAAVQRAADTGFTTHAWQLAWALTGFLDRRGHWDDLATVHRIALDAACRDEDRIGESRAHRNLAIAYARLRRYDDAHAHLLRALAVAEAMDDLEGQAHLHHNLGWVLSLQGHVHRALEHDHRALALYQAVGNTPAYARELNSIGFHHAMLGDHRQTLHFCQQAMTVLEALDDRQAQAQTLDSLGLAYRHLGDHRQAIDCLDRALALNRELGDRYYVATTFMNLGETYLSAGDRARARQSLRQAATILDDLDQPTAANVRARLRDLDSS